MSLPATGGRFRSLPIRCRSLRGSRTTSPAPNHEVLSVLAVDSDAKLALDDVVINDQVGCRPESRRAMLGRDARRDAPRREEIGVQEHAAGQMRHPQDVGQRVHAGLPSRIRCFGHVSRRAGHRPSTACRPTDGRISRPVRSCRRRTSSGKETEHECDRAKSPTTERYARCVRDVQAGALGHREGRDPGAPLRHRPQVPARTGFRWPMRSRPCRPTKSGS